MLVLNGADDPFIKPEQIEGFKKDMDAAKADKQSKAEAAKFYGDVFKR